MMNIMITPLHTIPKDKILSISIGFDDKNPRLCALIVNFINTQSLAVLYTTRSILLEKIKAAIDKNWESNEIFDLPAEVLKIYEEIKGDLNGPLFYDFISEQHLHQEIANYQNQMRNNEIKKSGVL